MVLKPSLFRDLSDNYYYVTELFPDQRQRHYPSPTPPKSCFRVSVEASSVAFTKRIPVRPFPAYCLASPLLNHSWDGKRRAKGCLKQKKGVTVFSQILNLKCACQRSLGACTRPDTALRLLAEGLLPQPASASR